MPTATQARRSPTRCRITTALVNAYWDAATAGGTAHGWRVLSAVHAALLAPTVERAMADPDIPSLAAVLQDIADARTDAADRIDAATLLAQRVRLLATRHQVHIWTCPDCELNSMPDSETKTKGRAAAHDRRAHAGARTAIVIEIA